MRVWVGGRVGEGELELCDSNEKDVGSPYNCRCDAAGFSAVLMKSH